VRQDGGQHTAMAGRDASSLNNQDSGARKDASVKYSAIEHNVEAM
jgi:hypothetical protein